MSSHKHQACIVKQAQGEVAKKGTDSSIFNMCVLSEGVLQAKMTKCMHVSCPA